MFIVQATAYYVIVVVTKNEKLYKICPRSDLPYYVEQELQRLESGITFAKLLSQSIVLWSGKLGCLLLAFLFEPF